MNILSILEHADKVATLTLNGISTVITDYMWQTFSCQEVWYALYLIIAIMTIRRLGWKKGMAVIVSIILTIVACDQLANFTKEHFARLRPCWDPFMTNEGLRILEDRGGQYGFYSAHAANAAGFAICSAKGLMMNDKSHDYHKYASIITVWFIFVGMSRIFVGKHFLGDVLTGFAVGILFALTFSSLTSILLNRSRLFRDQNQKENPSDPTR